MNMSNELEVSIKNALSPDLALRIIADKFFDYLESLDAEKITIDFNGIVSISRSFAHQYTMRKERSSKEITETNVPVHVKRMFEIVKQPKRETSFEVKRVIKLPV